MSDNNTRKLSLNRETLRQLDQDDLGRVAGGQMQTAGTCPVSACICVTGEVCRTLSAACAIAVSGVVCR